MSDHKNKGYIPWHDRVDEKLILELSKQFVDTIYSHGLKIRVMNVKWCEHQNKYEIETLGEPLVKAIPDEGEHVH